MIFSIIFENWVDNYSIICYYTVRNGFVVAVLNQFTLNWSDRYSDPKVSQ